MVLNHVSRAEFSSALFRLGCGGKRTVALISDLAAFGQLHESESGDRGLGGYIDCIMAVAGPGCTLVAPTFTYARRGPNSPYIHEETPSETGALTEYMRCLPGAARTVHPVFSFVALGDGKADMCAGVSNHSYGWNSVTHRLVESDALVLSIGRSPHRGSFFIHLAEVFAGVPYRYTKELSIPVHVGGKRTNDSFRHFVKYTDSDIVWDTNRLVERLEARGLVHHESLGASGIWAYSARGVFDTTIGLLKRNIYGLLAHPPENKPWQK